MGWRRRTKTSTMCTRECMFTRFSCSCFTWSEQTWNNRLHCCLKEVAKVFLVSVYPSYNWSGNNYSLLRLANYCHDIAIIKFKFLTLQNQTRLMNQTACEASTQYSPPPHTPTPPRRRHPPVFTPLLPLPPPPPTVNVLPTHVL